LEHDIGQERIRFRNLADFEYAREIGSPRTGWSGAAHESGCSTEQGGLEKMASRRIHKFADFDLWMARNFRKKASLPQFLESLI